MEANENNGQNNEDNVERVQEKNFFDELARIELEISGLLQPIELQLNSISTAKLPTSSPTISVEKMRKDLVNTRDLLSKYNGLVSRVKEWLDEEFIGNDNSIQNQTKERINMKLDHCQQDFQRLDKQWKQSNRQFILKSDQLSKEELFSNNNNQNSNNDSKTNQQKKQKNKQSVAVEEEFLTKTLQRIRGRMQDETSHGSEIVTQLVRASQIVENTVKDHEAIGAGVKQGSTLITRITRKDLIDKIMFGISVLFFICVVLFILKRRLGFLFFGYL